jgi:hypothetical protein
MEVSFNLIGKRLEPHKNCKGTLGCNSCLKANCRKPCTIFIPKIIYVFSTQIYIKAYWSKSNTVRQCLLAV